MASFGDYVTYDGLIYRVVAVSEDAEPTYTLEPIRTSETALKKTVDVSQSQLFLVPSGGSNLTEIAGDAISKVGSRTAMAKALADGYVRVKFDSNDGTAVDSQVVESGAVVVEPDAPTREHYTFDAWYYDDETFAEAVTFAEDTFDDDTTLYAKWIIDTFTVTYDSNEGSAVASETVDYGGVATEPDDPTLADNRFDGWYTDDETFAEAFDFETAITEDITLYAKWVAQVTVTFNSNGGSAVDAQTIDSGALATEPADPTLAESTFDGWYYDDITYLDAVDFATDVFIEDTTVYAKWV